MGCGSSQATKIANDTNGGVLSEMNGDLKENIENLENEKNENDKIPLKYPPGEAFEIPLETDEESLIKKHPPKRLQKLMEDRPQTPKNIGDLEEKLANAEMRRQQILHQRVSTLKLREKENIDVEGMPPLPNSLESIPMADADETELEETKPSENEEDKKEEN